MSSSHTFADLQKRAARIKPVDRIGEQRGHINAVAFSPDSQTLAMAGRDLILKDLSTGESHFTPLSGTAYAIAFSPDGNFLAACGAKGFRMAFRVQLRLQLDVFATSRVDPTLNCLAFSPDGNLLAIGSNSGFLLNRVAWDTPPYLTEMPRLGPATGGVNSVFFSPDGNLIACGCDDNSVRVYDLIANQLLWSKKEHERSVGTVAFSPDGAVLASGSGDNTIRLWQVNNGHSEKSLLADGRSVKSIVWSPDGSFFVSRSRHSPDGIRIWHRDSGRVIHSFPQLRSQNDDLWSLRALAISPNGRLLATYPPETVDAIQVWDLSPLYETSEPAPASRPLQRLRTSDSSHDAIVAHMLTLPLTHATPPTPSRPASWLRGTTVIGVRPPLCIVQDLGTIITHSKPQLARPKFLPTDIDTSSYFQFLARLSTQPLLRQVSVWDLSDSMVGVILARLLDGIEFSKDYASFNAADVVSFARNLSIELDRANPEEIWRTTDPAVRPSLNTILPPEARAKIEANLRRLDADELRFMHQYGPRFAGAPDPRDLLDLFSLVDLPPAVQQSLIQMLRLIPRVSQAKSSGGAQIFAMGGYAGLTNKGSLDSLVPTELAYPDDVLLYRLLNQEALYYGREAERERSRELVYLITQTGLDLLGDGDVLARALTLALSQTMQRRGYEVQQSFVGSQWTEPSTMLRPADVTRVLYHRDKGSLEAKAMLEAVLLQLRAWSERYRSMQVMWIVSEHWDIDDLDNNRDLYNAIRQHAEQQAWFIRVGNGTGGGNRSYPAAARQFRRHQLISSDVMWADIKPPERIFVTPEVDEPVLKEHAELRYDGLYVAQLPVNRWNVLRFFANDLVASAFFVGSEIELESIYRWFQNDFPSAMKGPYTVKSSDIEFKIVSGGRAAEYYGTIGANNLALEIVEYVDTAMEVWPPSPREPILEVPRHYVSGFGGARTDRSASRSYGDYRFEKISSARPPNFTLEVPSQ